MLSDRTDWVATGMRLPRLSAAVPPAAATALFAGTGLLWMLTTRPGDSVRIIGSGAPFTLEQGVVLLSTFVGTAVLLGGLFAIGAYLVNWPQIMLRELRVSLDHTRTELDELHVLRADLVRKIAELQRALAGLPRFRDELTKPLDDVAPDMRRVRRLLADLLAEVEGAAVSSR